MSFVARIGALAHAVAAATLAGAVAGAIAGGLGGRLAMRVTGLMATESEQGRLTEAEEAVGKITLDGTLALIVFGGIAVGILGGLIYAATRRWFADAGAWRGLVFGVFLLGTLGWGVIEGDNFDFSTFGAVTVNVAMFSAIFLLFGVLVAPLYSFADRTLVRPSRRIGAVVSLPFYALGLLFAFGIAVAGFDGATGDARRAATIFAYLIVFTAVAAAVLGGGRRRFERLSDLRGDTRLLAAAVAVIVVPLAAGLALDTQALNEILRDAY